MMTGGAPRPPSLTRCLGWLGASAAAPPHMWQEQGQRRALCALLPWTPWVVVTVPALVPCARW